jgi:L-arabinonolactonase
MKITRIDQFRHKHGEGPLWDSQEQTQFGTDLLGRTVWRYDPRTRDYDSWSFDGMVSSLAMRAGGGALVATSNGLHLFDFPSGRSTFVVSRTAKNRRVKISIQKGRLASGA